jgi:hypothetical protein
MLSTKPTLSDTHVERGWRTLYIRAAGTAVTIGSATGSFFGDFFHCTILANQAAFYGIVFIRFHAREQAMKLYRDISTCSNSNRRRMSCPAIVENDSRNRRYWKSHPGSRFMKALQ